VRVKLCACLPAQINMRTLLRTFAVAFMLAFVLTACGYRTPLSLPKPEAKPSATAPAEREAK